MSVDVNHQRRSGPRAGSCPLFELIFLGSARPQASICRKQRKQVSPRTFWSHPCVGCKFRKPAPNQSEGRCAPASKSPNDSHAHEPRAPGAMFPALRSTTLVETERQSVAIVATGYESGAIRALKQIRCGDNKRPFHICKFRTMTATESRRRVEHATRNDFHVTRMGRFMRRFIIDGRPQLANVLRGEMSLVAPRPHMIAHPPEASKFARVAITPSQG
jgi:hypothetical protein